MSVRHLEVEVGWRLSSLLEDASSAAQYCCAMFCLPVAGEKARSCSGLAVEAELTQSHVVSVTGKGRTFPLESSSHEFLPV